MMMILVFFCLWSVSTAQPASNYFDDYWPKYDHLDIDHSALKFCYVFNGVIGAVENQNADKGYKCTASIGTWVADDAQAMDACMSRLPYHIIKATNEKDTGGATCTFQINLKCELGWFQIMNKCYQLSQLKFTYKEAEAECAKKQPALKSKIATYYDGPLALYMQDMWFGEGWVDVPNLEIDYPGRNLKAILIMNSGFKYDARRGSIRFFPPDQKFEALCEYTPPMTMAEMYLLADLYSEIYPIHVTTNGASFSTSSFLTIEQKSLTQNHKKDYVETFATDNIRERCKSIGAILNVDSHPMASIQEEFDTVKPFLTEQRFHLTSAFKNGGCQKTSYQDRDSATGTLLSVYKTAHLHEPDVYCNAFSFSFHSRGRYPSMAAMRAPALCSLHSFTYEYGDCGKGWIRLQRSKTTWFCHKIVATSLVLHEVAKRACNNENAVLSGFETSEEFEELRKHLPQINSETHYWLGGVCPCIEDCTNTKYHASWDRGVSRNTKLLNSLESHKYAWGQKDDTAISYRSDANEFHSHNPNSFYMYYICGKYPPLIIKKKEVHAGHRFRADVVHVPTYCEVCNQLIWHHEKLFICVACRISCHKKCQPKVTHPCHLIGKTIDPQTNGGRFFGASLTSIIDDDHTVPPLLDRLFFAIETRALFVEGVYRKSGSLPQVRSIRKVIESTADAESVNLEDAGVHVLTTLVKAFFRELAEPIIIFDLYENFLNVSEVEDMSKRVRCLSVMIELLPKPNRAVLDRLMYHLARVADQEAVNKMGCNNLALIFGPCVLRRQDSAHAQEQLNDVGRQTGCVQTLIEEKLKQYKATLHNIVELEDASHKVSANLRKIEEHRRNSEPSKTSPNIGTAKQLFEEQLEFLGKQKERLLQELPPLAPVASSEDLSSSDENAAASSSLSVEEYALDLDAPPVFCLLRYPNKLRPPGPPHRRRPDWDLRRKAFANSRGIVSFYSSPV